MITDLTMLQHVVEHAERWRLSDKRFKQVDITAVQANITLPDNEVALFVEWVRNLGDAKITASATYARTAGIFHASGRLMSGHVLHVYVTSDSERMRRAGLTRAVLLAEVEQYVRRNAVGLPMPGGVS